MKRTFCHLCATKLEQKSEHVWCCPGCGNTFYGNPKPCTDIALFNDKGEMLICKRAKNPYKGKYDLPGGFIDLGDTVESGLLREIKEELGLSPEQFTAPVYVSSRKDEYPFGDEVHDNIVMMFMAQITDSNAVIKPQDDVAEAVFVSEEQLDTYDIVAAEHLRLMKLAFSAFRAR